MDQAKILSLDNSVTVPAGSFTNVLKVLESTQLEPGKFEHKLYAPGVGLVLIEEDLREDGTPRNPIPLTRVTVIPLPPGAWTGLATMALVLAGGAVRRLQHRAL